MLTDHRAGIIRATREQTLPEEFPPTLFLHEAFLSDSTLWSDWPSDPSGTGCRFWDENAARHAAVGEAVERYCGNLIPPLGPPSSYRDLRAAGLDAVDPRDLALFSPEQYATPGFPFQDFHQDLPVRWAEGQDVAQHTPVLVPASLVWVTYFRAGPSLTEPRTNPVNYAGIAAGPDPGSAQLGGLLEIIERDAVNRAWLFGATIDELRPPAWLAALAAGPEAQFDVRFLCFPAAVDVPVVGALVIDREHAHVALGTACHADTLTAATKALAEGFQLLLAVRQLDDPDSTLSRIAATKASPLKPWRQDRRYTLDYRADLHDATDLACNLQLWLDPALLARVPNVLSGRTRPMPTEPASTLELDTATQMLTDIGARVLAVDLTTPDIREAGLAVQRMIVPGLRGNSPAALPYLGRGAINSPSGPSRPTRSFPPPYA